MVLLGILSQRTAQPHKCIGDRNRAVFGEPCLRLGGFISPKFQQSRRWLQLTGSEFRGKGLGLEACGSVKCLRPEWEQAVGLPRAARVRYRRASKEQLPSRKSGLVPTIFSSLSS